MKSKLSLFLLTLLLPCVINAATIDLNNWNEDPTLNTGNWTVAQDGSSVYQSVNTAKPAVFLSDTTYINTTFEGSFKVENGNGDDDYIGFVFGWQSANDFYLFDWKKGDQTGSQKGYYLSHVTDHTAIPFGDHHVSATGYEVITTNLGTGWVDNTLYNFVLDYTVSSIKISIGGTTIFEETGSYADGNFGFLNYSQPRVTYVGFTEDVIIPTNPNAVPEPTTMLLFGFGLLGLTGINRKKV